MYNIAKNGIIQMHRGDCLCVPLFINIGTEYNPIRFYIKRNPGCKVYLGVMEPGVAFEEANIRKMYDSADAEVNKYGDIVVRLTPTDTEFLSTGRYYYQVKVESKNGCVTTVIPLTQFFILE